MFKVFNAAKLPAPPDANFAFSRLTILLLKSSAIKLYFGIMTAVSIPKRASSFGSAPATSASPPDLTNGTHSETANKTFKSSSALLVRLLFL